MPREEFDKALNELQSTIETVQGLVEKMIIDSIKALETRDLDLANKVVEMDDEVDKLRDDLEQKAIFLIASEQPLAIDLRKIITALRVIMELERMGDYAEGIAKINLRIGETDLIKPLIDIPAMSKKSIEMMRNCLKAYKTSDVKLAERVCQNDDEVDGLKDRVINELLQIMMKDPTASRQATYLIFIAHNLERIADRSTNIADCLLYTSPSPRDRG